MARGRASSSVAGLAAASRRPSAAGSARRGQRRRRRQQPGPQRLGVGEQQRQGRRETRTGLAIVALRRGQRPRARGSPRRYPASRAPERLGLSQPPGQQGGGGGPARSADRPQHADPRRARASSIACASCGRPSASSVSPAARRWGMRPSGGARRSRPAGIAAAPAIGGRLRRQLEAPGHRRGCGGLRATPASERQPSAAGGGQHEAALARLQGDPVGQGETATPSQVGGRANSGRRRPAGTASARSRKVPSRSGPPFRDRAPARPGQARPPAAAAVAAAQARPRTRITAGRPVSVAGRTASSPTGRIAPGAQLGGRRSGSRSRVAPGSAAPQRAEHRVAAQRAEIGGRRCRTLPAAGRRGGTAAPARPGRAANGGRPVGAASNRAGSAADGGRVVRPEPEPGRWAARRRKAGGRAAPAGAAPTAASRAPCGGAPAPATGAGILARAIWGRDLRRGDPASVQPRGGVRAIAAAPAVIWRITGRRVQQVDHDTVPIRPSRIGAPGATTISARPASAVAPATLRGGVGGEPHVRRGEASSTRSPSWSRCNRAGSGSRTPAAEARDGSGAHRHGRFRPRRRGNSVTARPAATASRERRKTARISRNSASSRSMSDWCIAAAGSCGPFSSGASGNLGGSPPASPIRCRRRRRCAPPWPRSS